MLPNNYMSSGCNLEALLLYDRDLFANLQVPEGVDKVQVVSRIRRDHGLAPLWHPDPIYLKNEIYWWSTENLPIWRKLYATTKLDYNPIWNTDATERVTDVTTTERDTSANSTALNHGGSTANRQGTSKNDGWDTRDTAYQEDTVGDTHRVQDQDTTGTSNTITDVHTTGQADGTINETTKGTSKTQTDGNTEGTSNTTTDGTSTKTGTVEETVSAENADTYQPDTRTTSEENITSHETVTGATTGESHETVDGQTIGEMHNDHHDTTAGTSHTVSDTNTAGTLDDTQDTHTTGHKETTTKEKGTYGDTGESHDTEENKHHDRTENWEAGKENAKVTYQHGWTKQGNIGVTSTQQLIAEERDSVKFNIYQFIADSFQRTFCLDIY